MMNLVKVMMNLLNSGLNLGLKALRCGHGMVSEFFFDDQPYVGLENLGNTCYCNSVLQALYFCAPFRNKLLEYRSNGGRSDLENNNLLTCLVDLFHHMDSQKNSHVSPTRFVELVMEENEIFSCSETHQDAHEFLIFLLNNLDEEITKTQSFLGQDQETEGKFGMEGIREIFGGIFINETRCSCCESVTCREEPFMDLSLEIEQNSSLSSCFSAFSAVEKLSGKNKYWCDKCCHFQEAEKNLKIKSPPQVLICQLKRFKYSTVLQGGEMEGLMKLFYRVAFPMEYRLPVNSRGDRDEGSSDLYSLFAVVVHVGRTVNYGHYIALVKSGDQWLKFDDEKVETIEEVALQDFFGSSETAAASDPNEAFNAYILFYQTVNGIESATESGRGSKEDEEITIPSELQ